MPKEYDILQTATMPAIALRGLTVFPNVLIHFEVAREASAPERRSPGPPPPERARSGSAGASSPGPPKLASDLMVHVLASQDPGHIADYIAQNIPMRNSDKQAVLEEVRPMRRLEKLFRLLEREVEILTLDQEIQERATRQISR